MRIFIKILRETTPFREWRKGSWPGLPSAEGPGPLPAGAVRHHKTVVEITNKLLYSRAEQKDTPVGANGGALSQVNYAVPAAKSPVLGKSCRVS